MNDEIAELRRDAVVSVLVRSRLEALARPKTYTDKARNGMIDLLQDGIRERRAVLGDRAYVECLLDEILAHVVALADLLAERSPR